MKSNYLLCALLFLVFACQNIDNQNVVEQTLNDGWTLVGDTLGLNLQVGVPSVVQQCLFDAGVIPHPYCGTVEDDILWVSNHSWVYSLDFEVSKDVFERDVVQMVFEGIDTYAVVSLNGEALFVADNQFREWTADVKSLLKENGNRLEVDFMPYDSLQIALYEQTKPMMPEKYAVSRKAPYQHGWDWAPKYKNVGIWKPVKLVGWDVARLENAYIVTNSANEDKAGLTLHLDINSLNTGDYEVEVLFDGKRIGVFPVQLKEGQQHSVIDFALENPELWWPNGMGVQHLYDVEVRLMNDDKVLDSQKFKSGIRTVEMVDEPDSTGRAFYFKVNGVPMYAKGANYVPEEMIETWTDVDNTLKLLQLAKNAHFNMLRVWGGGVYPDDDFFNICDSLGILVWEDFMYAGTMYPFDESFLENAEIEAIGQVKRLASHPSLALWCGGNEISEGYYNWGWQQSLGWSDDDDKAIKAGYDTLFESILPHTVDKYDGSRPYWPSSPSKGWGRPESLTEGDVHYWGVWWGELPFEAYRDKVGRFNSEYGYQSYPDMQSLKEASADDVDFAFLSDYQGDSLYELICRNAFLNAHEKHARGIRQVNDFIEKYFPKPRNLGEYVYLSQLSQAYGMEVAIEAHRTAKPYNMGTLYWQLNDAWPVVSWSSIDYYGRPKALHFKLKTLYAPILLSLDSRQGRVVLTSDLMRDVNGVLAVRVCDFGGNELLAQQIPVELKHNENKALAIAELDACLSKVQRDNVYVKLQLLENNVVISERYCYLAKPKELGLPNAGIEMSVSSDGGRSVITLNSKAFAKDVCLSCDVNGSFSDNYFDMEPNTTKCVTFVADGDVAEPVFSVRSLAD